MKLLWGGSAVLALIIEFIALISYWNFGTHFFSTRWVQILGGFISVGVIIIIWGAFFAPKASHPLPVHWALVGKFIILSMPSYMWFIKENKTYAAIWSVILIVHLILLYIYRDSPFI
ncbi:YrdB family protein [Aerococcaceae bacterium DSM 111021]|nr:YrdB family protein [Aerococcaceae bacterium DSM 111021]